MWLVAGLGNPGPEYAETRHNIGFGVVECWAARRGWRFERVAALESRVALGRVGDSELALLMPQTFMNRSGRAVVRALVHFGIADPEQLLVVYDDLDLPFGRLRLRPSGGAGGHRGLGDIQARLERHDFPRLRVGIGRPAEADEVIDHVLSPFSPDESRALGVVLERGVTALEDVLRNGTRAAMNRVNAPPPSDPERAPTGD